MVHASPKYSQLNVLFEKVFSSKATSAPVERVCLCDLTMHE
jgi:hypothetical protein